MGRIEKSGYRAGVWWASLDELEATIPEIAGGWPNFGGSIGRASGCSYSVSEYMLAQKSVARGRCVPFPDFALLKKLGS